MKSKPKLKKKKKKAHVKKVETSEQSFLREYDISSAASIPVVISRSKEPARVLDHLRMWAVEHDYPFFHWNNVTGWQEEIVQTDAENPTPRPAPDRVINGLDALLKIDGTGADSDGVKMGIAPAVDGTEDKKHPQRVLCVMVYPHWDLDPKADTSPAMIQCLKQYVTDFARTHQRLVLIVPDHYSLPPELADDIPIIDLGLPSAAELRITYDDLADSMGDRPDFDEAQVTTLMRVGCGLTEVSFGNAVSTAIATFESKKRWPSDVPFEEFSAIIAKSKTEAVKRSGCLTLMDGIDMKEVGGLENYKQWLIETRDCYTEEFQRFCNRRDMPKGTLLAGSPGTGKTIAARATATALGLPLIAFDLSAVLGGIVGESEGNMRNAITLLEALAPCVAFVDEVDKSVSSGGGDNDGGVRKNILKKLLTTMSDGNKPIFWIMAANRIEGLPAEFLRRGRFDEVWGVMPPNAAERKVIFDIHLRARNFDPANVKGLDAAVKHSAGYVGAELEAAVKDAVRAAFHTKDQKVTGKLILEKVQVINPISKTKAKDFQAMTRWAADNARPASAGESDIDEAVKVERIPVVNPGLRSRSRALRQ